MARTIFIWLIALLQGIFARYQEPHLEKSKDAVNLPVTIQYKDRTFSSDKILKTPPGLFSLMNFKLLEWNCRKNKDASGGAVLTVKTKRLLFGDECAMGKILVVDSVKYEVIGVIKDIPEKSCHGFDVIFLSCRMELSPEVLANLRSSIIM